MNILPQGKQFCATQNQTVPLFATGKNKPVAHFDSRNLKLISGRNQFLTTPPGIAFDVSVYEQAKQLGGQVIEVTLLTTGDIYSTSFDTFSKFAVPFNRGFGKQIALPIGYWRKNNQPSEMEKRAEQQAAKTSQLSMFDTPSYAEVHR